MSSMSYSKKPMQPSPLNRHEVDNTSSLHDNAITVWGNPVCCPVGPVVCAGLTLVRDVLRGEYAPASPICRANLSCEPSLHSPYVFRAIDASNQAEPSDVALVSYFTGLSTAASVAQQLHTIVRWRDIKLAQFQNSAANVGNPELAIAGQSTGLDLVFFYIQYYSYNVEATLAFFWSIALTQSIFQMKAVKSTRKQANYTAKAAAVLVPILLVGILRLDAVQKQSVTFLLLADSIMGFCLSGTGALLIVILVKYIHTRRNLLSWNVRYGQRSNSTKSSDTLVIDSSAENRRQSIYDRWLVVRFSIAFVALA
ncbi:glycoside hydrolase [Colletotrichum karsti]|uniref:Glycoside hydrolase n=1 Tax=Colletotrichum karsti TaxID=1095194 RepID=A0A9P6IFJ3_9PEZI|nr:glycoside hydrolase [Colletotrichum karsti]KAF9881883.1 glycoside hydrolase [Colletotrichum karsti]